jgi:cyclophilin family peptidyl-prolyl cis-trans isomerase
MGGGFEQKSRGRRATKKRPVAFALATLLLASAGVRCDATVVRFSSVLGNIVARLYNARTPATVANFTTYANENAWTDTFIHRSVPGFVVQGGGFNWINDTVGLGSVVQHSAVVNEPGISNLRGTIAMAKLGGDPNSATNQWFFSLADNSANLDNQNGGFTVFGRVVGNGMTVVDAIAALQVYNAGSPFDSLPLRNYVSGNVVKANLVTFSSISVLNVPAGDYNFDGAVNGADLAVWKADLGSTTKAEADGNGDGLVDGADLLVWQRSLGQNFGPPASAAFSATPEPTAAALAAMAALAGLGWRRRLVESR